MNTTSSVDTGSDEKNDEGIDQSLQQPFLTIRNKPIYFCEDWHTGIGGGLWSTGLAMAHYLTTDHAYQQVQVLSRLKQQEKLVLLELGSGNGFLAVCWWAMAAEFMQQIIVTDTHDHLELIKKTIDSNKHLQSSQVKIHVLEHKWGEFSTQSSSSPSATAASVVSPETTADMQKQTNTDTECSCSCSETCSTAAQLHNGSLAIDIIIGSDVAYREELYDPLIASLLRFSSSTTVALIGVAMTDTTPEFFIRLKKAGFTYHRLEDYFMESKYRGNIFGIFIIQKKKS